MKTAKKKARDKRKLAAHFLAELMYWLQTCCQGDQRQQRLHLPRRVSHSDVINCRRCRSEPQPIGLRHWRAQGVFLKNILFTLSDSSCHQLLSHSPSFYSASFYFWLIQPSQQAVWQVESPGFSSLMRNEVHFYGLRNKQQQDRIQWIQISCTWRPSNKSFLL